MKSFHATIASLILLLAFNAAFAQPFAYISNQNSNSVSVINTATNLVVATVAVGSSPYGVAANVAGNRVYVTNSGGTRVSVIDTATATVAAIIGVGTAPNGIAVSPDGTRVYVANSSNSVSVINTTTNLVTATVPTTGTTPFGVAVNPAGTRVYVTHNNSSNMNVIDTSTNSVVGILRLAPDLEGLRSCPTARAYMRSTGSEIYG